MGFGSIFGSLGRAVKRPFKDVHKAVMGSGRFMNRGFGKMTGGINKTGRAITGQSDKPAMNETGGFTGKGALSEYAPKLEGHQKVKGSQGKKKGEWIGSKYIGPK